MENHKSHETKQAAALKASFHRDFFSTIGMDPTLKREAVIKYLSGIATIDSFSGEKTDDDFDLEDWAAMNDSFAAGTRRVYGRLRYHRAESDIGSRPLSLVAFTYIESGSVIINGEHIAQGGVYIVDYRRPFNIEMHSGTVIRAILLPAEKIETQNRALQSMHGREHKNSVSILLKNYIISLIKFIEGSGKINDNITKATYALVTSCMGNNVNPFLSIKNLRDQDRVRRITAFIRNNIQNKDLSLGYICKETGISRRVAQRVFEDHGGINEYLRKVRLSMAHKALSNDNRESIYEIAEKLGFSNSSYFSYAFRKEFGVSPTRINRGAIGKFYNVASIIS
ncbi:helix-turn-helix transcriptional regulator [Alcanivoracaceae bacterium MT1]